MIDRQRAGMDPRIIAGLLFLGGGVLLAFTLAMNYQFAKTVALTEQGQMLRGYTSLAMDAFGAVLMLAGGFALAARHKGLAAITFLFALFFLVYSAWNVVGFGATERLGAQLHRDKTEKAALQHRKEALELRTKQADWLNKQSVEIKGVDSRKMFSAEASAQIDKAINERPVLDKELPPDAQATLASEISGKGSDWWQKADVLALALLLIAGKAIGFGLGPLYLPRREAIVAKPATPASEVQQTNIPFVKSRTDTSDASSHDKRQQAVARFFAESTKPKTGSEISADKLLVAYNAWAKTAGAIELKANGFGRACNELAASGKIAISRRNSGQMTLYSGFEIIAAANRTVVPLRKAG